MAVLVHTHLGKVIDIMRMRRFTMFAVLAPGKDMKGPSEKVKESGIFEQERDSWYTELPADERVVIS